YVIKEFFRNYFLHCSDIAIDLKNNSLEYLSTTAEPWVLRLVDTGADTQTGGRLKRVRDHLPPNEPFCLTYGDGLANIDIASLIAFHKRHGKAATVSAVAPPGRYGALEIEKQTVRRFVEKPHGYNAFISGGFFVLQPSVIDRIEGDATQWERAPLEGLAR